MTSLFIKHHNSATWIATIVPRNGDTTINVANAWFTVKRKKTYVAAWAQKTIGDGITLEDNGTGSVKATISFVPADTNGLPNIDNSILWDLQIKTDAGEIYTVLEGPFIISAAVTLEIA